MNIKECYLQLGGDYEDVLKRLHSETLVQKFVVKFLNDQSYELLLQAIEDGNAEEAFRAAHTIKGICQNLSFTRLYESSHLVTELFRAGKCEIEPELLSRLQKDYEQTATAIRQFQEENAQDS